MTNTSRFNRYVSALRILVSVRMLAAQSPLGGYRPCAGGLLAFDMPESLAEGGLFEELFGAAHHQRMVEPLYYALKSMAGARAGAIAAGVSPITSNIHATRVAIIPPARINWRWRIRHDASGAGRRSDEPRTALGLRAHLRRLFLSVAAFNHNSEIASHQASCNTLCPEAETKLFVMPAGSENIDEATEAHGGQLYSQLVAKIKASDAKPPLAAATRRPATRSIPKPS